MLKASAVCYEIRATQTRLYVLTEDEIGYGSLDDDALYRHLNMHVQKVDLPFMA